MSTPGPTRRIPQRAEPPARLLLPGEYRAPEPTQENAWDVANSGQHTFVQASGLGPFPTADMVDALHRVRGELGDPHLPFLPELPHRGWRATTLARTIATFDGLHAEGASYGWRLTHTGTASRESALAYATYESDINALADVVGQENSRGGRSNGNASGGEPIFKIQLTGVYTLAASIYLPSGERSISDPGATRDIRESLLAGLRDRLETLRQVLDTPDGRIAVQLNEPDLHRIIAGSIPTVSGFRRIRSIPAPTVMEGLRACAEAITDCGASPVLNLLGNTLNGSHIPAAAGLKGLNLLELVQTIGGEDTPATLMIDPDAVSDTTMLVPPLSDPRRFEIVAALIDAGARVWLPAIGDTPVPHQVRAFWRVWGELGLGGSQLAHVVLTERAETAGNLSRDVAEATAAMARTAEAAQALAELSG